MGLDAAAYFIKPGELKPDFDIWSEEFEKKHPEEDFYWRNCWNLDDFVKKIWLNKTINDDTVDYDDFWGAITEISESDLDKFESIIKTTAEYDPNPIYEDDNIVIYKKHPVPDFYQRYDYTEALRQQEYDLEFINAARQAIASGMKVYYTSG